MLSLNVHVQVRIEREMIHMPNEDDTVGFDAFPPPHIALINIHLCVSVWRQQTACTASYTPSAIDLAMRWRTGEKNTEMKEAESQIAAEEGYKEGKPTTVEG